MTSSTGTAQPFDNRTTIDQPAPRLDISKVRRTYAGALYQVLRVAEVADLAYDNRYTVTAGPVTVCFTRTSVNVTFPDIYNAGDDNMVELTIPGGYTLGGVATVVEALVQHPAVTA